jgi:Ser/Thr protein kinase RdoA (MazF antagonist)
MPRPTTFKLPALDILGPIEERVDAAPVPTADKALLLGRLVELREQVSTLRWPLAEAVVHGDAHDHNVMIEDGQALLIDFARFAWGQPEWDLAVTATEYVTGGWWSADEYATFRRGIRV